MTASIVASLKPQDVTWDQVERMFALRCRAGNLSAETAANYAWTFRSFRAYLTANGHARPAQIDAGTVRGYLDTLKLEGRTSETVETHYRRLRTVFGWLYSEGLILLNPMAKVSKPKVERRLVRAFNVEEIKALLAILGPDALGRRDNALICLLIDSGARISEALGIKLGALDLASNSAVVLGKGRKERRIAFGTGTRRAIMSWLRFRPNATPDEPLFCDHFGKALSRNAVRVRLKRLTARAGIAQRRLGAHALRHTFAVSYLNGGGGVNNLQLLLGHTDPSMALRYARQSEADAIASARAIGVLDNLGVIAGSKRRIFKRA